MSEEGGDEMGGGAEDSGLEGSPETHMDIQKEQGPGEMEDSLEDGEAEVDLKAMADDYAKYLVVDSPRDVSIATVRSRP